MKTITLIIIAVFFVADATAKEIIPASNPVKDQYIVVLDSEQFVPRGPDLANERREQIREKADTLAHEYRGRRDRVFSNGLTGFSTRMGQAQARALANDPRVAYVAEDGIVRANSTIATQLDPSSWGLDRIDQQSDLLDSEYQYVVTDESDVAHVYVLDTGIRDTHVDFEGRVDTLNAFDAIYDGNGVDDCNGHGTFVAGVAGGREFGTAKDVVLHPVRVLDCYGNGTLSSVISGIDWVTRTVESYGHPAVANLSLGTGASDVLDNAVRAAIDAGVTFVIAAGNNGEDACNFSPARVDEAITVAASTEEDLRLSSSNHGSCVDVYAPGSSVVSAYNRDDEDRISMTGTSAAAPHLTGIAANILVQDVTLTPQQIEEIIKSNATPFAAEPEGDTTELLAYSFIDLSPESDPESDDSSGSDDPAEDEGSTDPNNQSDSATIDFDYNCQSRSRVCAFEASAQVDSGEVQQYFWDFGDGSTWESKRPQTRHRYRQTSGEMVVILAVELADGSSAMTEKTIQLPF
ncbi:S8 family serine peptidase [Wenzhouxiangella sp. EGI_FJ10305]|uniref:S8 family serine peptidase n=1 Tax=Wenzhouxiangella sp. EGI_FJ10305 TaxID=3243768 RepID=UPI0035D8F8F4